MTQFLQNAVYGTVLILAVAALRGTLKNRLLPEARLALWAVCLFRLFTPIAPTSALSFWRLFGREARETPVSAPALGSAAAPNAGNMAPTAPVGAAPAAPVTPAAPAEAGVSWGALLAAVWIIVGAVLAARYVLSYVRTRRAVERAIPLGREDARYASLPKCARLREGPLDGAPLTFGVARPTVVLTPGLGGAELTCVLAHEGVHARRRDNLWHYAAAVALTVFWWDPAVWLMARLIRRDVELSCDRAAVRCLGADRRAEYAAALVTLSTQAEGGAFCHGFGPKRTEERIISIMKYKKATVTGIALTLALVLAVTVGFASNPGEAKEIPDTGADTNIEANAQDTVISTPERVWSWGSSEDTPDKTSWDMEEWARENGICYQFSQQDIDSAIEAARAMLEEWAKEEWVVSFEVTDVYEARTETLHHWFMYFDRVSTFFADWTQEDMQTRYIVIGADYTCEYDHTLTPLFDGQQQVAIALTRPAGGEWSVDFTSPMALNERANNGETAAEVPENGDQDGMYICTREDCGNNSVHEHDGVMYKEWRGKISMPAPPLCTREDCPHQPSVHYHDWGGGGVVYVYNEPNMEGDDQDEAPICQREDCPIQPSIHFHNKDGSVSYISNDLPSYVDEGDYTWEEMEKFYMTPDEYVAKVEEFRAELQAAVDKGLITQEEMDVSLACARGEIERVRSGEMVPFYNVEEGERPDGLTFTFGYENADFVGSVSVMRKVPID